MTTLKELVEAACGYCAEVDAGTGVEAGHRWQAVLDEVDPIRDMYAAARLVARSGPLVEVYEAAEALPDVQQFRGIIAHGGTWTAGYGIPRLVAALDDAERTS